MARTRSTPRKAPLHGSSGRAAPADDLLADRRSASHSSSASPSPSRSTTCWSGPTVGARRRSKIEMIYTAPHEFFFTQMKLALFGAVCLAFPVIATQIYKFVAPGLYKNERQASGPISWRRRCCSSPARCVVYFLVMPLAMKFFLSMEQTGGPVEIHLQARVSRVPLADHEPDHRLRHLLPAARGADAARPRREWSRARSSGISAAMPSSPSPPWPAVLSPPDPFSMIAMALPTILLYEASIWAVARVEKRAAKRAANPQLRALGAEPLTRSRTGRDRRLPSGYRGYLTPRRKRA